MANGTKNRAEIVYRVRIFRVKHNRLYCGDLFTIHSPLVFDLQSRSVFCVCVWFGFVIFILSFVILNANNDAILCHSKWAPFHFWCQWKWFSAQPHVIKQSSLLNDTVITDSVWPKTRFTVEESMWDSFSLRETNRSRLLPQ